MSAFAARASLFSARQARTYAGVAAGVAGAGAVYLYNKNNGPNRRFLTAAAPAAVAAIPAGKGFDDYQKLYNAIAEKVREDDGYDGGAGRYGLLCRLAWHASGTYDLKTKKGGSYGGTMIYEPESSDPGNAGLEAGRDFLAEFGVLFPWVSRGDLWTLAGVVAVQEAGGPKIPWRAGRKNVDVKEQVPANGNLPDASRDGAYVRQVFTRLGFNDREAVALLGAHCLGKCHAHRSGFDGPWGPSPNMFTNDFFVRLLQGWHVKEWDGPKQWEDDETKSFMMLPTDYALKEESYFIKYVKMYAKDEQLFFKDFAPAYARLLEGGITFPKNTPVWQFKTLDDQE